MADYLVTDTELTSIANAIRTKGGTSASLEFPQEFVQAINDIETGGGGGESRYWVRPAEYPDLDSISIAEDEVYLSYKTNEPNSFASITTSQSGTLTFDIGTIENGAFVVSSTSTSTGSSFNYAKELTGYATDYVVIRISGNIVRLNLNNITTINGHSYAGIAQYCVEICGNLPHVTTLQESFRYSYFIESVKLTNMVELTSLQRTCGETTKLQSFYVSGTTKSITCYCFSTASSSLQYLYLNGANISNMQTGFQGRIKYTDLETANVDTTGSMSGVFASTSISPQLDLSGWSVSSNNAVQLFDGCRLLKNIDIHTWSMQGDCRYMFRNTGITEVPTLDYSRMTNIDQIFNGSALTGSVTLPVTSATTFGNAFQYCRCVRSVTIPATYTGNIVFQAFRDTNSLEEIHFLATTPPPLANANAFNYGATNSNRKIYVPYSADHSVLNAYKSATNWSSLTNLVEEEP